jgi:hypothetical protein
MHVIELRQATSSQRYPQVKGALGDMGLRRATGWS